MTYEAVLVPMAWSDGRTIRPLNRAGRRLLGTEPRLVEDLFSPPMAATFARLCARCARTDAGLQIPLEAQLTADAVHSLQVGARADGAGGLVLTLIDRTEALEAAARDRRSSRFLKELLDQTPTIFFVVDRGGQVVFRNEAFDAVVGPDVEIASPASMPQLPADFHKALATLFRTGTEQQVQLLSTDASGAARQLQLDLEPLRDLSGEVHQALILGVDLTELITAHAEQRRLQGELGQAARLGALGQMAGTIAHDFNNFLSVMMGSAMMLRELIPAHDEDVAGTLDDLEHVTRQAKALTQDLMSFSRAQVHAVRTSRLAEVLRALQASLPRLVPPTISFSMELPRVSAADTRTVSLSESQILQIAVNLVQNAVEATKGEGLIRVTVSTRAGVLELHIADNGPGVPEAVRARIFEPFFTTREDSGGTGLGLSSVRTLVQRVGGALRLDTSAEGGALFCVVIPILLPG